MKTFILLDKETSQVLHETKHEGAMLAFINKYSKSGIIFECIDGKIVRLVANIDAIH